MEIAACEEAFKRQKTNLLSEHSKRFIPLKRTGENSPHP